MIKHISGHSASCKDQTLEVTKCPDRASAKHPVAYSQSLASLSILLSVGLKLSKCLAGYQLLILPVVHRDS